MNCCTTTLMVVALAGATVLLAGDPALSSRAASATAGTGALVSAASGEATGSDITVKVEGAQISHPRVELTREQRTPHGELDALRGATARLKTDKALSVGASKLPPGEYRMRIEIQEGGLSTLVIEPLDPAATPTASPGVDGKGPTSKEAGTSREASPKESGPILRARLALAPCQPPTESVSFLLRPASKGTRLRITVRAGGTEGRANLRIAGR